jgi:hypothetical protein
MPTLSIRLYLKISLVFFPGIVNGNGDPYSQGIELDAYPTLRLFVIGKFKILIL